VRGAWTVIRAPRHNAGMAAEETRPVNVPDTARCLRCGYLLRGLPERRCPECGTEFDPAEPETYADPARPKGRRGLEPLGPPSLIVVGAACAFAAVVGGLRCTVQGAFGFYSALGELGCLILVPAAILFAPGLVYLHRLRSRRALRRAGRLDLLVAFDRHILRWRVFTVAMILTYLGLVYPWPVALRFCVSWPWLSRQADAYLTDRSFRNDPQRVGLWDVRFMQGRGQGFVWFDLDSSRSGRFGLIRYDKSPSAVWLGMRRWRIWIAPSWYLERW